MNPQDPGGRSSCPQSAPEVGKATTFEIGDRGDAVRAGRRFVAEEVVRRGAGAFVDDSALVAAELLANARQHGKPPIRVSVAGTGDLIRLEVHDASSRLPVRAAHSTANMTGRGLALVDALSSRWGIEPISGDGKVVWAEFDRSAPAATTSAEDVDALVAEWSEEFRPEEQRYTVVLGNVPTDLLIKAKAHVDNLVREFSLASAAGERGDAAVPAHLARLIETVTLSFRDARDAIKRQALAAARRGETQTTLTLTLPLSAAAAGEAYLAGLDEADEYARAARLLTLETPADHRLFRHWYVEAVVRQLRQLAAGLAATPITSFEDVLVSEIRRLSAAQRVSERAARLQRVTAALARARTPEDVAAVVVGEGVQALGASGGGLFLPAADGEHLAVPGVVGYASDLVVAFQDERLDAPLPAATAIRTGEAVWLESREDRDRGYPMLRGMEAATISMCAVPLLVANRTLGALRFSFDSRKLFDEDERSFVLALAAQTAATLQRTEIYESERQATLDLQRALLPMRVPEVAGWDIAAYYSPAGEQEAGGDFYDVFEVGDGRTVAIVGDVMGRGLAAAAAMAEVRSTIRAYALDNADPRSVFERVDRFFQALDLDQLVTALYFVFDERDNNIEIINAGHLPPVVVDESGSRLIETIPGTPFGVGGLGREALTMSLPATASIIGFTDGLVERRGEDIDAGVERLVEATEGGGSWEAQRLLDHIVQTAAAERAHDDDVTVVVLRRL